VRARLALVGAVVAAFLLPAVPATAAAAVRPWMNAALTPEDRAAALLAQMTLEATGAGTGAVVTVTFPVRAARYLRIVQTGSSSFWWSIAELNAFP
jgi:hypothetical protein